MTLRNKIAVGSLLIALAMVIGRASVLLSVQTISRATERQKVAAQYYGMSLRRSLIRTEYMVAPSEDVKRQWIEQYEEQMSLLQKNVDLFKDSTSLPILQNILASLREAKGQFLQLSDAERQGKNLAALSNAMSAGTVQRIKWANELFDLSVKDTQWAITTLYSTVVIGTSLAFLVVIAGFVFGRRIAVSLGQLADGAQRIANGQVGFQFPIPKNTEFADVARSFNHMGFELRRAHEIAEKRIEERTAQLRESNLFLDAILENIPNMVFVKDAEQLRFVLFNRAAESLLGYKREEMIGKSDADFFPKEQAEFFINKDRQVLGATGIVDIPEEPIKTREGETRWLHTRKISVRDEKGNPRFLLGISEDITDLRKRESEIKATFEALNQTALVSITDAKGNIMYANDKFVRVSQYSMDELLGNNHRMLKSGHQPQSLFEELWRTISSGKAWRGEIKNRAKDGSYYWVDTAIAPLMNPQGRPERYIAIRFLVTEQKKALAEIQKFQLAVDASTEAVSIVSSDHRTIVYVNDAWCRVSGFSPEDALGKNLFAVRSKKTDEKLLAAIDQAMKDGTSFYSDAFVLQRKDGSTYDAEIRMFPVTLKAEETTENPASFFVLMHADITERKKSERAKTAFVSLASHQLRTPLTEIRWALSSLRREHLDHEQEEMVRSAHAASSHMAETIKAMLTLSHIESGEVDPEPTTVNVRDVIEEIVGLNGAEIRGKNLTVSVDCATDASLVTDEQLLKEILGNLIANACKYSKNGGAVSVSVATKNKTMNIVVQDDGCGIPIADQQKISQKFFRASNAMETGAEGSGLGLHIAYSLVHLLHGKISFVSKESAGTRFTLTFPLAA